MKRDAVCAYCRVDFSSDGSMRGRRPSWEHIINDARIATRENNVGAIVLKITGEGFYIENVAVRLSVKGKGVGRQLLELAESEAARQGYGSIYLATHELMTENRSLYSRIGYLEYDHRVVNGYPRVFFRKALP